MIDIRDVFLFEPVLLNRISNLAPSTGLEDQELSTHSDSEVTSAGISGANDDNLNYLGSRKKLPAIHGTTLDLSTIIKKFGNIHEVFNERLGKINSQGKKFTPGHELDPAELAGGQRGWRIKNYPPTVIVKSLRRAFLAQTTTI